MTLDSLRTIPGEEAPEWLEGRCVSRMGRIRFPNARLMIVRSAERSARDARRGEHDGEIEPGAYLLRPGTSERRVLARLREGRSRPPT